MKEFNLKAALNGEPVVLRNGKKAYVTGKIPSELTFPKGLKIPYPLYGFTVDADGNVEDPSMTWTLEGGSCITNEPLPHSIAGMWEEPKISAEDLPKPFKPATQEQYFTITSKYKYDPLYVEETANFNTPIDNDLINQGNAFRTREDAQKWLDFMKSMME